MPPEIWWAIYLKTDAGTCLSMGQNEAADALLQTQEDKDHAMSQAVKHGNLNHVKMLLDMDVSTQIQNPPEDWHHHHKCTLSRLAALYGHIHILLFGKQLEASEAPNKEEGQQGENIEEEIEVSQDIEEEDVVEIEMEVEMAKPVQSEEGTRADEDMNTTTTCQNESEGWISTSWMEQLEIEEQKEAAQNKQQQTQSKIEESMTKEVGSGQSEPIEEYEEDPCFGEDLQDIAKPFSYPPEIYEAALAGHLEIVQCLLWSSCTEIQEVTALEMACKGGHLEVTKWILRKMDNQERLSEDRIRPAFVNAACEGHEHILQFLLENFRAWCPQDLLQVTVDACQLETIKWLLQFPYPYYPSCGQNLCGDAPALKRRLDILTLLSERFPKLKFKNIADTMDISAADYAAQQGWMDILQWLLEFRQGKIPVSHNAMDLASKAGRIEVLEWLHENTNEGCSRIAVNEACYQGHTEVVKFLHANYSWAFTEQAMHQAAMGGHMEILNFLNSERKEGCHSWTITCALWYRRPEVVAWLWEHRYEKWPDSVTVQKEYGQQIPLKEWLEDGAEHRLKGMTRVYPNNETRTRSFDPPLDLQVCT